MYVFLHDLTWGKSHENNAENQMLRVWHYEAFGTRAWVR